MHLRFEKNLLLIYCLLFYSTGSFLQKGFARQQNQTNQKESIPQTISQQRFHFEHIGQKQGLEQKQIRCITQDSQGYLWLGTSDGLVRYDGYDFRTFRHQPGDSTSIHHNEIHSLFEDSRGWLWIGTSKGLSCYSHDSDCFVHVSTLSPSFQFMDSRSVLSICEDAAGAIWLGTQEGLLRLVLHDEFKQKKHTHSNKLFGTFIQKPVPDIKNNLQIPWSWDNLVKVMLIDSRGVFWVGTERGLCWLKPKTNGDSVSPDARFQLIKLQTEPDFKNAPQAILKKTILGILEDKNASLWILTISGLTRIDMPVLPQVERSEILILGGKQIKNHQSFHFKEYPIESNKNILLPEGALCEFSENREGKFWIGLQDHPLAIFNPRSEKYTILEKNDEMKYDTTQPFNVLSIFWDDTGVGWIGTARDGLFKYDPQKDGFSNYHPELEKISTKGRMNMRFVFEDSKGFLWLAQERLYRCNRYTGEILSIFWPAKGGLTWSFMNAILEDRYGHAWIACESRGLYRFDVSRNRMDGRYLVFDRKNGWDFQGENVTAMTEDSRGFIWAASTKHVRQKNGIEVWQTNLFQYNPGEDKFEQHWLKQMDRPDELGINYIYSIHADGSGFIWIGSSIGFASYDPQTTACKMFQHDVTSNFI